MTFLQKHTLTFALTFALAVQIGFWNYSRTIKPDLDIVPDVPGKASVKALSFGDEQAFFRVLGLSLQNAGDTFGRFTALYKYDFTKLYGWFTLLDALDNTSDYIPTMATYYFGQTQHVKDVRYVIDYLSEHAHGRISTKWWWQVQAVYLAQHKLKDLDLALAMAKPLEMATNAPIWVQQMPAFVHEKRGEFDSALKIMEDIEKNVKNIPQGELNFMQYFIKERIKRIDDVEKTHTGKQ